MRKKLLFESVEDAWDDLYITQELLEEEVIPEIPEVQVQPDTQQLYVTRSGSVSRPPNCLLETAYAVIREMYQQNFCDERDDVENGIVECTYDMKALLFQKALEQKPEEAMKALREEVKMSVKIDIWDPIHLEDMSEEERKMIIPQMMNYLEKYNLDMAFDKYKVRMLARGDKQLYTGESEGPVARVKSLLMMLSIAAHEDLAIFKVDVGSAFMGTPMADDVKHKWVRLDKRVLQILMDIQPEKYKDYILPDGTVIVQMKKLSYGYVEALLVEGPDEYLN
jgi:hypothetical protein